ncbi:hypothetical protein SGGMMB4_04857 [Sodalis glossinidius str. 'morsitans']|uniref:Uncharacterized protein n=1 Tax=Sodalis glossinidius (strain morsitans) TaxID=343509 RepID=A0A193QN45_SODGM|nr:hypothetical protein SGGMMB4_04857 [Sodalis glossinidius str. 'morsitans']
MINFNVSADRYAQFMDASLGFNGVDKKKKPPHPIPCLNALLIFLH